MFAGHGVVLLRSFGRLLPQNCTEIIIHNSSLTHFGRPYSMRRTTTICSVLLGLILAGIACARGIQTQTIHLKGTVSDDSQIQSTTTTVQSFTAVEGADLMAKLEAARTKARSASTPYWSAYAFDVRSGVAVDPAIREFHGSINTIGDTSVFIGTTVNGLTVETRN